MTPLAEEELLLRPREEVEESRMVTEELRIEPSGLKILCRIYENYGGIYVDCQVSSCKVLTI